MKINLYYIDGISNIDTPYFGGPTSEASMALQEDYFDNNIVKSIEYSFYPPHYQNVIKFDSEDVDFNTTFNYLSLEFNNKRYYYFVDDIEYVSESIMRVYITMDVIQTYMFNIEIKSGIIERKFIDRWIKDLGNAYKINREYIRENVSNCDFVFNNKLVYNKSEWFAFVSVSKFATDTEYAGYDIIYSNAPGNKLVYTSYPFYIIPIHEYTVNGYGLGFINSACGVSANKVNTYIGNDFSLGEFLSKPETISAYICPFNPNPNEIAIGNNDDIVLDDTFVVTGETKQIGGVKNVDLFAIIPNVALEWVPGSTSPYAVNPRTDVLFVPTDKTYQFNFIRNNLVGVNFSSVYMPVLFDENYIRYTFGSRVNYTSIPLYYLEYPQVYGHYTFNPSNGNRIYWLTSTINGQDIYNTCVIDNNVLNLDIKSVAWKEYVASNRGRWGAVALSVATSVFSETPDILKNTERLAERNDIINNPKNYDKRYKNSAVLKQKPASEASSLQSGAVLGFAGVISRASLGIVGHVGGQLLKEFNIRCTPPTPKNIGDMTASISQDAYIMSYEEHVNDYEQCAQYYHRNGYLLNRYINYTDTLFEDIRNDEGRYYFNVLKMQLPEVHLRGVPEDELTVSLIKERLVSGLRLWNVDYPLDPEQPQGSKVSIGDFQYDNVELSFIE